MRAHTLIPAPPIRECRSDVPEPLTTVLDRMLAKCPADRYATPADVIEALEPFIPGHNLTALLSPARFVPTITPVSEPDAADRARSGGFRPVGVFSRRWHPRWDWSRPPTFSKPIAVSAVLTFVTLLYLAQTIASRWPRSNSDQTPVRGDLQGPPAHSPESIVLTGERVPAKLTIRLYRFEEGTDDLYDMGRIGDPRDRPQGMAVVDLRFVVEAEFDKPLFPYLISVDQLGRCEIEFPEKGSALSKRREFKIPSGDYYLSLEAEGLLALILLGSDRPLSSAEALAMVEVQAEDWKHARTGVSWLFDGERYDPLALDREIRKVPHGLKPFSDSFKSLSSHAGIAAVRAIAFPVRLAPKNP